MVDLPFPGTKGSCGCEGRFFGNEKVGNALTEESGILADLDMEKGTPSCLTAPSDDFAWEIGLSFRLPLRGFMSAYVPGTISNKRCDFEQERDDGRHEL